MYNVLCKYHKKTANIYKKMTLFIIYYIDILLP